MAAHAISYREQLVSHTKTVLVDTIDPLQKSYNGVSVGLDVHEVLTKIHIFDSVASKLVGNIGFILGCLFNSASR